MLVGIMLFVTSYFTGVVAGRVDNPDLLRLLATIHVVGMQVGLCMVGAELAPDDGSFMLSLLIFGGVLLITAICMFSVFVINLRSCHRASSSTA
jgi:hypothetical protein